MLSILVVFMLTVLNPQAQAQAQTNAEGLVDPAFALQMICEADRPIDDHMRSMARLITSLRDLVDEILQGDQEAVRQQVRERSQLLRIHLSSVLPKIPPKVFKVDPQNHQRAHLVYQTYILRVMQKTLELELELLKQPADLLGVQAQQVKIADLILEIESTVATAHSQFRD